MIIGVIDSSWDYTIDTPYNRALGGTQSAICYFAEEMTKIGHKIFLFNGVKNAQKIRDIYHIPFGNYGEIIKNNSLVFDLVIVSCLSQIIFQLKSQIQQPKTMYALWMSHDVDQNASLLLNDEKVKDMVDLYIFVSNWQKERYIVKYNIQRYKTLVMKNGIGKSFEKYLDIDTNKHKNSMTYCSIPWRGLDLLPDIYKKVKDKVSDASLEIYSDMNIYMEDNKTVNAEEKFNGLSNVNINKGISQNLLSQKLSNIEFLTYPNIFEETSCITVLQAMACGCLIITSNLGALRETMGELNIYIDVDTTNFNKEEYCSMFTLGILKFIELSQEHKNILISKNKEHIKKNHTWEVICKKFTDDIFRIKQAYDNYVTNHYNNITQEFMKKYNNKEWKECFIEYNKLRYHILPAHYYITKLNLGVIYFNMNALDKAKKCFKQSLQFKNDYNTNKNIAMINLKQNNIKKFIKYAQNAMACDFNVELGNLLAEKYELIGLYNDSFSMYESIIYLDPKNINCHNNLGNLNLLRIARLDDIENKINKIYYKALYLCIEQKQHRKKELVLSNLIFNNLYNWKLSDQEIFEKSCIWYKYFEKEKELIDIVNKLDRSSFTKKIRVGYISCDFIIHPVGFMFSSILKNHNTENFDIFCYDCCDPEKSKNDILSKELHNYNNAEWRNTHNLSDKDLLEMIVNDKLDILVDMMGHTRNTRMNVLQYKPAKVQISYFAYPSTNGLDEIDYRFTDKYANPPETQKYFKEKLYYLPNGFQCYTPPKHVDSIKNYERGKYKIHLCCFNNPIKLSIPTIDTFCEILKRLPQAKLFLRYCYYKSSFQRANIVKLFTDRGIESERIDIGYEQVEKAIEFYNNMDIVLDPFPYNGGTISSEALYMNTPFITLEGTNYVSRVGVSLLSNLGLEEYIAKTKEEYVKKVVDLANNEKELKFLHQVLRIRMLKSDLANSKQFTLNVESAYKDMISKLINGVLY